MMEHVDFVLLTKLCTSIRCSSASVNKNVGFAVLLVDATALFVVAGFPVEPGAFPPLLHAVLFSMCAQ
ncbi:MAG: hypothetical protein Q4D85_12945 [Corynebacterium sp.]|uniref:hypothetical protein n=1 Tax=Corynebacterium sp. TaxID=1720 RepID=UPI0026DA9309|nr:hypothetical protein [Corynebacterium sp.]MDO5099640.1 hypothetical protein [Corynebacterium sp.]